MSAMLSFFIGGLTALLAAAALVQFWLAREKRRLARLQAKWDAACCRHHHTETKAVSFHETK